MVAVADVAAAHAAAAADCADAAVLLPMLLLRPLLMLLLLRTLLLLLLPLAATIGVVVTVAAADVAAAFNLGLPSLLRGDTVPQMTSDKSPNTKHLKAMKSHYLNQQNAVGASIMHGPEV